jgi:hypothetical protein
MLRLAAALLVSAILYRFRTTLLWPGTRPDPALTEPVPQGSLGCPWIDTNVIKGSRTKGPEFFYRQRSRKLGDPRTWKFYFIGIPCVAISGKEFVQKINALEFTETQAIGPSMRPLKDRSKLTYEAS